MKSVLAGLFVVCSFVRLSVGIPPDHASHDHAHASPDDTYRITLHILSGAPDPTWTIPTDSQTDPARLAKIIKLINLVGGHGPDGKQVKKGGQLVDKNGYKGLTIEHIDAKGTVLHEWTMARCTSPVLEWNLVVKTAPTKKVSLKKKLAVHEAIEVCRNEGKAKPTDKPAADAANAAETKPIV